MKETSNKKYIAVMCLSVFCLVVIIASVTYAYFTPRIVGNGKDVNVAAGKVKLEISETKIEVTNLLPIRDGNKDRLAEKNEFTISRKSDSNLNACYSLYLVIDEIGDNLKNKWFKYEFDYGSGNPIVGDFASITPEEDGTLKLAFVTNQELSDDTVNSRNYTLRVWLSYSDTEDQSNILKGDAAARTFKAHILAEGVSGKCKVTQG